MLSGLNVVTVLSWVIRSVLKNKEFARIDPFQHAQCSEASSSDRCTIAAFYFVISYMIKSVLNIVDW